VPFLFVLTALGLAMLTPIVALHAVLSPVRAPTAGEALGIVYMGIAASVVAFICWNKGVAVVGANSAGITIHLLPAFGTVLAILFLGESFAAFHALGIATIFAGVVIATRRAPGSPQPAR
jgi:drug/metabolite transporter (DMT)-like permease